MWARNWFPSPSPLRGARDEPRDVDELDDGGEHLRRACQLRQPPEAHVWDGDDADVRLDRAERVVGRLGAGLAEGVEQRALADVREPDDADAEGHAGGGRGGRVESGESTERARQPGGAGAKRAQERRSAGAQAARLAGPGDSRAGGGCPELFHGARSNPEPPVASAVRWLLPALLLALAPLAAGQDAWTAGRPPARLRRRRAGARRRSRGARGRTPCSACSRARPSSTPTTSRA